MRFDKTAERWGVWSAETDGVMTGNPYTEREIFGEFTSKNEHKTVRGFFDGERYVVRFMPAFEEAYSFRLYGNYARTEETGTFTVTPPSEGNHGPVSVTNGFHFAYADGTPHFSFGTTCYVWELQEDALVEKTLETLKRGPFNKIRFCVFPKHYDYNLREPRSYPFEGTPMDSSVLTKENFFAYTGKTEGNNWDFTRFEPGHFRHIEKCVEALRDMNIEADIILFHPYDRWGFSSMTRETDERYLRYVIARLSAYRNVWWSLANEYDLLPHKTEADWENIARVIREEDAYRHPRSIHNCISFYDHTRPWITHASIQRQDLYRTTEFVNDWRVRFDKPIVCDEIAYEGNIQHGWGNISGQELTRRFWEAMLRGGYAGHGETFMSDDDILWWSHGGTLKGESPARIGFLRKLMEELPCGLRPVKGSFDETCAVPEDFDSMVSAVPKVKWYYYGFMRPSFRDFYADDTTFVRAEVIDTWNMTVTDAGVHRGHFRIPLPGHEWMAVRLTRV